MALQSDSDQEDEDMKSLQAGVSGYKRLITIHAGKPKGSLKTALKGVTDQVRRLSLSEHQLEKLAGSHGLDIVRYLYINIPLFFC